MMVCASDFIGKKAAAEATAGIFLLSEDLRHGWRGTKVDDYI